MTDTDFILLRLRTALALHSLFQKPDPKLPANAYAGKQDDHPQLIPVQQISYTGFSLQIVHVEKAKFSLSDKLRSWWIQLCSAARRLKGDTSVYLAEHAGTRVLLHFLCLLRDGQVRWHLTGIMREFQKPARA